MSFYPGAFRSCILTCLVSLVAILCSAAPASAEGTCENAKGEKEVCHIIAEIGGPGSGAGELQRAGAVAVDQSTKNIWVDDINGQRVMEYKPSGQLLLMIGGQVNKTRTHEIEETHEPVTLQEEEEENLCTVESGDECGEGTPGAGPGQFNIPSGIAVYHNPSETAPAAGEVYISDAGNDRIEKFDTAGHYLMTITSNTHGNPTFYLPEYKPGLTADSNGDILALDWETGGAEGEPGRVLQFDQAGALTGLSYGPKLFGTNELKNSAGVAVDERGTVYVGRVGETVVRFSASGRPEAELAGTDEGLVVGVDPRAGNLFVALGEHVEHEGEVVEFSSASEGNKYLGSFGHNVNTLGMAYGVEEGELYVSHESGVSVYGPFAKPVPAAPSVLAQSVSGLSQTGVTLTARVDANVLDTTYHFEYSTEPGALPADNPAVGGSRTAEVDLGNGYAAVSVNAAIGVQPGTAYYYRVVSENEKGVVYGATQSFTSPALAPSAVTGEASQVTDDTAALAGLVTPGSTGPVSDTRWCFQYGTSTAYGQGAFPLSAQDAGQGLVPSPVAAELSGLWPDTLYHYRLVALNSLGLGFGSPVCGTPGGIESYGADRTFTTPSPSAPGVSTGAVSYLSSSSATIAGTVDPNGASTTYEFDVGTDTSYGVRIFGNAGSASASREFSAALANLQPGTTYHYRIAATSPYGTTYGADQTFTTPGVPAALLTSPPTPSLVASPAILLPASATESAVTTTKTTKKSAKCKKPKKLEHGRCVKTKPKRRAK
jgi:hypothetical protein